ncbi:RB-associated KRAB zinc finger protein-like [Diachasmimorpha longicaudata]|uniref:RB-associated KRAB zinc finger protein-like n=1 Tax=Diachasmimorpha longicaudata TaxID=58733 RepID=UPI0030B90F18
MRVKSSPKRTVRMNNDKQINDEVTRDSGKDSSSSRENLSQMSEESSSKSKQKECIGIWNVLDLTITGPSSPCDDCWKETETCLPLDYSAATLSLCEPIDLSTKARPPSPPNNSPPPSRQTKEFKDTFLYKMLTDPLFVENLKGTKNAVTYSCPFCKKQFPDESSLVLHQKPIVNELNKIACCACNKTFTQKRYLRYHQRSHSERTKYTCDICTKKYSRQDNLTRHNTFHTNPDKFPCIYCERTFSRKDLLNKHIKGHENRFNYHCEICDKYFKGSLSLDNHQKHYHKKDTPGESEALV